jgi:magnesium-transporting ATPase (P-type)
MQHKLIIVLLIVIFTISISQRESFAPIISPDNTTSTSNQTAHTSGSTILKNNFWYIAMIMGAIIAIILICLSMMRNQKSY